jgi:hypothetical protein
VPEVRWGLTLPFAGVPLSAHEPLVRRAEPRAMKERPREFVARGITTPVLTPIGADLVDELAP